MKNKVGQTSSTTPYNGRNRYSTSKRSAEPLDSSLRNQHVNKRSDSNGKPKTSIRIKDNLSNEERLGQG